MYALLASIIWGLDYTLAERALSNKISTATFLAGQMLVGTIIFATISACTTMRTDIATLTSSRSAMAMTLAAVLAFNVASLFICLSIQAKNATLAGLLEISYPIFIVLFSWLLFGEAHLTLATLAGGALIFAGVVIIYCCN